MNPQEMRRKAVELREKIKALVALAEKENREVTDDEDSQVKTWRSEAESLERRAAMVESVEAELQRSQGSLGSTGRTSQPLSGWIDAEEAEDDKRKSFDDFARCVVAVQKGGDAEAFERIQKIYHSRARNNQGKEIRALSGAIGSNAAFLIPEEFATEILQIPAELAAFADGVRTIGMSSPILHYPVLRQTGTVTAGESLIYAGVATYRRPELQALTASQPAFDQLKLEATDLFAYTEASRDVAADVPGLQSTVFGIIQTALAWKMDYEFLLGDGVGRPTGMLHANNPALLTVTRAETNEITFVDVLTMMSKLMAAGQMGARWITNVTTIVQLGQLSDNSGRLIWQAGDATKGLPATLMGLPVRFTEKVPALGTAGDLNLVAPSLYIHGVHSGPELSVSEHYLFKNDEIAWKVKLRNCGMPWMKAAYTQADGASTQVSCAVKLS